MFGLRQVLRIKSFYRRYRNTKWFEIAITAIVVLLSTSIYSLFYTSELRVKVDHLIIERDEIVKHKNSELNSIVLQLKSSINHFKELENDFGSVKVKLKDFLHENAVMKSKLLVEQAKREELVLISSSKEKRLSTQEKEIVQKMQELAQIQELLKEREEQLLNRELDIVKRENLMEKLQPSNGDRTNANILPMNAPNIYHPPGKTYAIYRVLYGEDFIQDSILSIIDYCDKIFVFWDDTPWGDVTEARYKGTKVPIPKHIDNVVEAVRQLSKKFPNKIVIEYDHSEVNVNQVTHLVNDHIIPAHGKPDLLIFVEWDHVWRVDQLEKAIKQFLTSGLTHASSHVKECYRTPQYVTKDRNWRMGTIFWNLTNLEKMPKTGMHANEINKEMQFLDVYMHNMGLCMNPETMLTKVLIAIAFSEFIGDTPPDDSWYEQAWLKFDFETNNHDLEMALGYRDDLPVAYEYNTFELPPTIQKKFVSNAVKHWRDFEKEHPRTFEKQLSPDVISTVGGQDNLIELLTRYINLHKKILHNEYNPSMEEKEHKCSSMRRRYVIMRDWEETGFGNRLQVLVSGFLFALITDRALLVDWPDETTMQHWNGEEVVAMKAISNFFLEPDFDWDYSKHKERIEQQILAGNLTDTKMEYGGVGNSSKFYKGYRGVEDGFQCYDFDLHFTEDVVSIRADNYFALNMAIHPLYRDFVKTYFGSDVFGPLSRFLFRPVPEIQTEIDSFIKDHFGKYTIGVQIRRVGGSKLNETQEDKIWQCAEEASLVHHNRTVYFLTTDREDVRERAKQKFGDRVVYYDKPIGRADVAGLQGGIIDMWLLSRADDIIVSAASTYGRVSYGMKGKAPLTVNRLNECNRRVSSQPCFFTFERYRNQCFTDSMQSSLSDDLLAEINTNCDMV